MKKLLLIGSTVAALALFMIGDLVIPASTVPSDARPSTLARQIDRESARNSEQIPDADQSQSGDVLGVETAETPELASSVLQKSSGAQSSSDVFDNVVESSATSLDLAYANVLPKAKVATLSSSLPGSPVISNVKTEITGPTTAIITFSTNETVTSLLKYGTAAGTYSSQTTGAAATSHSLSLSGLLPDRAHFYLISVTDTEGNAISLNEGFLLMPAQYSISSSNTCGNRPGGKPGPYNTGPCNPSVLKPYTGPSTITVDGTVIENFTYSGTLRIEANNVTIRNFTMDAGHYGIVADQNKSGIVIEDGEIYNIGSATGGTAILGRGFTARRLNIHHSGSDAIKPQGSGSPVLIEASWFHHLGQGPDSHADAIQMEGLTTSLTTIRGNHCDMTKAVEPGFKANSCVITDLPNGNGGIVLIDNWFNGGGWTLECQATISSTGMRFGRDYASGISSGCSHTGSVWNDTNLPTQSGTLKSPYIKSESITNVTSNSATISWSSVVDSGVNIGTGVNTAGQVLFGENSRSEFDYVYDYATHMSGNSSSHTATLTGLKPGTKYFARAKSRTVAGFMGTTKEMSFTTLGTSADTNSLSITKSGSGTVTSLPSGINCGSDCSEEYAPTTSVTLTATPATGYVFSEWGGVCTGSAATCQVTMSSDMSVSATFTQIVGSNVAPNVSVGTDKSITLPTNSVSIDASVTDDGLPTGSNLTYTWSKVSGAGTVTFSNVTSVDTNATFSTSGTYVLRLTASDTALSGSDDLQVVVAPAAATNNPPIVSAGSDISVLSPITSATLTGVASDSDGSITSYAWTKVSGGAANLSNAQTTTLGVSGLEVGSYTFRLTVTDNDGASTNDDVNVTVVNTDTPSGPVVYVRAGASGNGTDWTNALPNLPATLERGKKYYIAGGSYGSYVFDEARVGSGLITVRKATVSDHGTNTGWQQSYGTARATFTKFDVTNGDDFVLDGVEGYGIAILSNTTGSILNITQADNVTINQVEANGNFSASASSRTCTIGDINQSSHVTITNSIIRNGGDDGLLIRKSDNILFEGNVITELYGDPVNCNNGHSDGIEIVETSDAIFNRNLFRGIDDTSAFFAANWKNVTPTLTPLKRITFTNNIIHIPKSGATVYFNYMEDSLIANNTFWQARFVGIVLEGLYPKATTPVTPQPIKNLKMRNNIIASFAADNVLDSSGNPDKSVLDSDYNLIVAQEQFAQAGNYIKSANDIALNWTYNTTFPTKLFEDDRLNKINRDPTIHPVNSPDAVSFIPASTNPGINVSDESVLGTVNINGRTVDLSQDYFGNSPNGRRDIGAVEFGGTVDLEYSLSLTKQGTGTGTVTGTGISCGSDCTETYASVTSVTLTATPSAGSTFAGWTGACSTTALTCIVSVDGRKSVVATFNSTVVNNQAPSVNTGLDRSVSLSSGAALTASVTDDGLPTGSTLVYTWTKVSGPGNVVFGSANSANTSASFSIGGTYLLQLSVTDGVLTGSDQVQITVTDAPVTGTYNSAGGILVIETENTSSSLGNTQDFWAERQLGNTQYVTGATGGSHLEYRSDKSLDEATGVAPISYTFKVNEGGYYQLHIRAHKNIEDPLRTDQNNDAYVKVTGDSYDAGSNTGNSHLDDAPLSMLNNYTKIAGGSDITWGWAELLDAGGTNNKRKAVYNFQAGGTYTITMSGRSRGFAPDRIVFRKMSNISAMSSKDDSIPESSKIDGGTNPNISQVTLGSTMVRNYEAASVRVSASITADLIERMPEGSIGTIVEGPILFEGIKWWKVNFSESTTEGWVGEDPLEVVSGNPNTGSSYLLTVAKSGTGTGTVSGSAASQSYNTGTAVVLTATPDANSTFAGWSGSCSGTLATCTVTMSANRTVGATFNTVSVEQVATPTFSPTSTTSATPVSVTITTATPGTTIRYTTNGSTPTTSSTLYSGPIIVSSTATIKAIATKSGMTNSAAGEATYTITPVDPGTTVTSSGLWQNRSFADLSGTATRSGVFTASYLATPLNNLMDGVTGFSSGVPTKYDSLGPVVRFNSNGTIDARKGTAYAADRVINYSANTTYSIRLEVNVDARTYSVWVNDQQLAQNYAFRATQAPVGDLTYFGYFALSGSHRMSTIVIGNDAGTGDVTAPSVPANLVRGITTTNTVALTWGASVDDTLVTGYEIKLDGLYVQTSSMNSYTLTGLTPATTYTIAVRAFDAAGNKSSDSNVVTFTTPNTADTIAPTKPTGLSSAGITSNSVQISWTASTDTVGVAGYEILRDGVSVGTATLTSYSVTGLSPSTPYKFSVRAFDAAGNQSAVSSVLSVITTSVPDTESPSKPAGIVASNILTTSATIDWNDSSDNVLVAVYRVYVDGEQYYSTDTTRTDLSGLAPNTSYAITVVAIDSSLNSSDLSDEFILVTLDDRDTVPPSAPSNVVASGVTEGSAELSWTASTDNVSTGFLYQIYSGTTIIGFSYVPSFSLVGLTPGTVYNFRVTATDAAGNESVLSNVASFTTLPATDTIKPVVTAFDVPANWATLTVPVTTFVATDNSGSIAGYLITETPSDPATSDTRWRNTAPATFALGAGIGEGLHTLYAWAKDLTGNVSLSRTDTVNVQFPDTTIPNVNITAPIANTTISGTAVPVIAVATDASGIAKVEFKINGTLITTDTTAPYATTLNATTLASGAHTITAVAYDTVGNTATAAVAVIVGVVAPVDTDGDGVPDLTDLCPATPADVRVYVNSLGCPRPIANTFDPTLTTDFGNVDLRAVRNLKLGVANAGSVQYSSEAISLYSDATYRSRFDLDDVVIIEQNKITIKSDEAPQLNQPATVTLYGITAVKPVIMKDGVVCTNCTIVSYVNGTLVFTVSGFSTYEIISDTQAPTVPSGLSSSDVTTSSIKLSWSASSDNTAVTGYDVYRGTTKIGTTNARTFTDMNLSDNTAYSYTVRAYDASNNVSNASSVHTVTTSKVTGSGSSRGSGGSGGGGGSTSGLALSCSISDTTVAPGSRITIGATASKGKSPYTFVWSKDASKIPGFSLTAQSQSVLIATNGTYSIDVKVTGSDGKTKTTSCSRITVSDTFNLASAPLLGTGTSGTGTSNVSNISTGTSGTGAASSYLFVRDLTIGAVGEDVRQLQKFLNARGYAVSVSGAGSVGLESTYFGPATTAALARYQRANAISPAAGYFGPFTRGRVNGGGAASAPIVSVPTYVAPAVPVPTYVAPVVTKPSAGTTSVYLGKNLAPGVTDADVIVLQKFLNKYGFQIASSGAGAPGNEGTYYGELTKQAVKRFQASKGIPSDGWTYERTRAAINAMGASI